MRTLTCPSDSRYRLELDPTQVFPDDPGQGTPAMVYGPRDSSGTYQAATSYGELACGPTVEPLPASVQRWLDSDAIVDAIDELEA